MSMEEELRTVFLGTDPEEPVPPIDWLKGMIEACQEREILDQVEDKDSWFMMVREVSDLHDRARAALTKTRTA